MINLNFLRVGNFVKTESGYWQVTKAANQGRNHSNGKVTIAPVGHTTPFAEGLNWQGIEIDESTLQQLNFSKKKERLYEMISPTGNILELELFLNKYEKHIMLKINEMDLGRVLLKELHKIQNLYQVVTNEDLVISFTGDLFTYESNAAKNS